MNRKSISSFISVKLNANNEVEYVHIPHQLYTKNTCEQDNAENEMIAAEGQILENYSLPNSHHDRFSSRPTIKLEKGAIDSDDGNVDADYADMDDDADDGDGDGDGDDPAMSDDAVVEEDADEDEGDTTIVEHICGKCTQAFFSIDDLKRHLNVCRNLPKNELDRECFIETEITFDEQENHKPNECFCCLEDINTAHNGHIRCNFCPKSFKSHVNLKRHILTLHSTTGKFKCEYCNAVCPTQKLCDLHKTTHINGKPFSCQKCGKDFTRKYHLDRHRLYTKCDSTQPQIQLECRVCGKHFSRIDNLREHLRAHIGQATRRRDYQCPFCVKSFYGSSLLNIHIRTHTGEKPFPCDLCKKMFPSNGALRKHRRMHTGEKPYSCKECAKCFSAKETLNRHMKIHTGVRPHVCPHCNKRFIQATQLRAHIFIHTGENGFKCTMCNDSFNRNNKLLSHIKKVHTQPLAKYPCLTCDSAFAKKRDLTEHIRKEHKNRPKKNANVTDTGYVVIPISADGVDGAATANVDDFVAISNNCDGGDGGTVDLSKMCAICKQPFKTKLALKRHLNTVHLNKLTDNQCSICKRVFRSSLLLTRHMKMKHKDEIFDAIQNGTNEDNKSILLEKRLSFKVETTDGASINIKQEYLLPSADDEVNSNNADNNNNNNNNNEYIISTIYDESQGQEDSNENNNIIDYAAAADDDFLHQDSKANIKKILKRQNSLKKSLKNTVVVTTTTTTTTNNDSDSDIDNKDNKPMIILNEDHLKDKVRKLLDLLVDKQTLKSFGWPNANVENVLSSVIEHCGQRPMPNRLNIRENTKILFNAIIENQSIKSMLMRNESIDEIIMHVLTLANVKP